MLSKLTLLPSVFLNKAEEAFLRSTFQHTEQEHFVHQNVSVISVGFFAHRDYTNMLQNMFLLVLSSISIGKPLLQHIASNLADRVIIGGNLLTGEGAAGAVGGGQEIWDSLYGAVNYHRASPCDYTV